MTIRAGAETLERAELIDILRDYGDRENEDHYFDLTEEELVAEFVSAAKSGRERDYIQQAAAEDGWDWRSLTVEPQD